MLTPEEAARAKAEIELAQFFDARDHDTDRSYWHDLDITEEHVGEMNAFAEESPEQATSYYFLDLPRWMVAAKCYAETVIKGLADTYLRSDATSAVEAVSTFRSRCEEIKKYLWDEHFSWLALLWNQYHRQIWQSKLPDYVVPEITFEHFEIGMDTCKAGDLYCPVELLEDCIEHFWIDRARLEPEEKARTAALAIPTEKALRMNAVDYGLPAEAANPETIGAQIDRLRDECGLTIEELAEKVEIDPTNVSRHIRHESKPSRRSLRKYSRVFYNLLKRDILLSKTQASRSLNAASHRGDAAVHRRIVELAEGDNSDDKKNQ